MAQDRDDGEEDEEAEAEDSGSQSIPAENPSGSALITDSHVAYLTGSGGLFRPQDNLTRAEAAQIFLRLLKQTVPVTIHYTDVPAGAWYAEAAGVMGSLGVMRSGMSTFGPDEDLTRGSSSAVWPSSSPPGPTRSSSPMYPPPVPYAPYILSARAWGWVEGFSDGTLRPISSSPGRRR